tara:strand:+ start:140 stop:613 length:474 start_codon:yes stop_codon:yes gene_type:complete
MNKKRISLWDSSKEKEYGADSDRQTQSLVDKHNGEHTAVEIDFVLSRLTREQSDFIEYLILSGKNTVVARYDPSDSLLPSLVKEGLLQLPTGVGTVSVLKLTTTFRAPKAVWEVLNERYEKLTSLAPREKSNRIKTLKNQFEDRIDVLVASAAISND